MRLPTYEELEARVRRDLDLQDEDNFVQNDEMASYFNEAINDAEAEIMALNEDYFLASSDLTFTQGSANVTLPTDIYAQKIRDFVYVDGDLIYSIPRIRDPKKFLERALNDRFASGYAVYAYMLKSVAGAQDRIELSPVAQSSGALGRLWYIRNATRVPLTTEGSSRPTQLATVIDIPEWTDYLVQFVKCRCMEKEMDQRLPAAVAALANRKKMLVETLGNRTPDGDDQIPMDLDFYWEHN